MALVEVKKRRQNKKKSSDVAFKGAD